MTAELHDLHRSWTFEDLEQLPDDGYRYEIIDGHLGVTPPPSPAHQDIIANLDLIIREFVQDQLSPLTHHLYRVKTGVGIRVPLLGPERYLIPDMTIVHSPRPPQYYDPTDAAIVVEVTSDSTRTFDKGAKKKIYEDHGIGEYWLIDHIEQSMTSWVLRAGVYEQSWVMVGDTAGKGELDLVTFAELLAD